MQRTIRALVAVVAGLAAWLAVLPAGALERHPLPPADVDLVGALRTVVTRHEDTFVDIGQANHLGYSELKWANPEIDPWLPGAGREVVLPTRYILPATARSGVVLNLPEMRVYYFPRAAGTGPREVWVLAASIGRMDWQTPLGSTRITQKVADPAWHPPESIREEHAADGRPLPTVVPPGPDNPLGRHALRLGLPGYLLHGTNRPNGLGMRVTHGCVRLFPQDVAQFFESVSVGEQVLLLDQPVKFGRLFGRIFVEVHPPLEEQMEGFGDGAAHASRALADARIGTGEVDWPRLRAALKARSGLPVDVTAAAPSPAATAASR